MPERAVFGVAALCATNAAASIATAQDMVLEEVIVTARKRSENLQEIPLSISVFKEEHTSHDRP